MTAWLDPFEGRSPAIEVDDLARNTAPNREVLTVDAAGERARWFLTGAWTWTTAKTENSM